MAWNVFYSHSHKDSNLRDRLGTHLAPLRHQHKIIEWYDRKIEPGANWNSEVDAKLESAHLILLLISADFLASDYCFGVEVEKALERLKHGQVKVMPILLRECLWSDSPFSRLQIIPRDAKPVTSWSSEDAALANVASEIQAVVSGPVPAATKTDSELSNPHQFDSSLDLVRAQVRSYAQLYERTRLRMRPSDERTSLMEQIFDKMRNLATASYPLLDELAASPSPGERLAAVAILEVFSAEKFFPFLVNFIRSEKPFAGYHGAKALSIAVGAVDVRVYPQLQEAIKEAQSGLAAASVGFDTDRQRVLREAEQTLQKTVEALSDPTGKYD